MNLKFISDFLYTNFYGFDYTILKFWHNFAIATKGCFTDLFEYITFITEKGIIFIVLAVILMLFKKTRKIGICIFGAVGLGAIITNFILKDAVARPRPFLGSDIFKGWWKYIGSPMEEGFSFPSGHTTAAAAAMISVFLLTNKKKSFLCLFVILLVAISRNYLMAHYPTDVVCGMIVGGFSAFISYIITNVIYKILDMYDNKLFNFIKNFNIKRN